MNFRPTDFLAAVLIALVIIIRAIFLNPFRADEENTDTPPSKPNLKLNKE